VGKTSSLHPNIVKRHLHPALKALGYINPITGTARRELTPLGDSATRSSQEPHCRAVRTLQILLGHAPTDMSDLYDKVKYDAQDFRREWAENAVSVLSFSRLLYRITEN